jgi:hypothetical protein
MEEQFRSAVEVLGLSPEHSRKLMDLIIERYESSTDARTLALAARASLRQATETAAATVDEQIRTDFGEQVLASVHQMLRERVSHDHVQNAYSPAMQERGVPLSAQQAVSLAHVLWSVYSVESNPQVGEQRLQVDPATGLSVADKQALQNAASFLSPAQLQVASARLTVLTNTYRTTAAASDRR